VAADLALRGGHALLQQRSAVLGVEPLGVGTPLMEHAASVIFRTAWRNGLSLGRMIRELATAAVDVDAVVGGERDAAIRRLERALRREGVGLIGGSRVAATWVDWLARLTRRPALWGQTLLALARVLPDRGLLRSKRAYCPVHLAEWHRRGQPAYEPLLWQLRPVTVCPDHDELIRLETRCPNVHCRLEREVVTANAVPGMCNRCGTYLSSATPEVVAPSAASEWDRWVAIELGHVVAALGTLAEPPSGAAIPGAVQLAIARAGLSLTDYAKAIGVSLSTVSLWKDGRHQPGVDGVLRICRFAGFGVADFLLGRLEALEAAPAPLPSTVLPERTTPYRDVDWPAFERALRRALRDPHCPSPLAVARRWQVDARQARRAVPKLWRELSTRSQERIRREAHERATWRRSVVVEIVQALHDEGRYPGQGEVRKRLPRGIDFREADVMGTWRGEIARLGYVRRASPRAA